MSKFEALAKMLGIAVEDAAKLPPHVVETLEKVKTPEIAVALKGADMVPKAPIAPGQQPAYAEGGEVLPDGFQIQDQAPQMAAAGQGTAPPQGGMSGDLPEGFELQDDKYGTPGQMIKTGLEGAAEGLVGPLAPLIEKHVLGVNEADIRGRQETNPITHGIGQAAGLTGGLLTGTGEAAVMTKAGELALGAAGLGKGLETAGLGYKVGSAAVQQAAEMAVLSGSDEVSKMILNDPDQTAETALTNIGLSAALGGATGGLLEGTVSPLWKATVGPKVDQFLSKLTNHLNGSASVLPQAVDSAINDLGVTMSPEIKGALTGQEGARDAFTKLKYAQNPKIEAHIDDFHKEVSNGVMRGFGTTPEELEASSAGSMGDSVKSVVKDEYTTKYGDMGERYNAKNAENSKISISDDARLGKYDQLMTHAVENVGTHSPYYKIYDQYGQRLLAEDTVKGVDQMVSELGGEISKAFGQKDTNLAHALKEIRNQIDDFRIDQILKSSSVVEKEGYDHASALGRDMVREGQVLNEEYRRFASTSRELSDNLGKGDKFDGKGGFLRMIDKMTPEELLTRFSFKGNSEFIGFLQKEFPKTYEMIRQNELKQFLKPAILGAKEGSPINILKVNKLIDDVGFNQKEYLQAILPAGAIEKAKAGEALIRALPNPKDSGTPGGLMKLMESIIPSVMGAVGAVAAHTSGAITGGMAGLLVGEMASRLGKDAPEAMRLGYLKFLGSDQPIKAEGFKAMVDFFHNTYKGENLLSKATSNVFKSGAQVLGTNLIPDDRDRTKLDKAVERLQKNPNQMFEAANKDDLGHYLPNHQTAVATASARALQYLQTLKPQGHRPTPLDREIPPSKVEIARYNRALDIAQQPAIVLQHIKEGTLQGTDIQDLHNLYPGVYKSLATKLTNEMTSAASKEEPIPYKTRMGISLFLGQPMDSSMTPSSIMAAQPHAQAPQGPQQGSAQGGHKGSTKSLGKSNSNYQTPLQSSEADKGNRRG